MSEEASSASVNTSRSDPGWKYCTAMDKGGGTNKVRCNFCDKIMTAGITRGKEHLMGKRGKVAPCKKVPPDVKEELWKLFKEKTEGPSAENQTRGAGIGFIDEDDEVPTTRTSSNPLKGPMDLFCRNPISAKDKQKRQVNIREGIDKELTARVHQSIARFWYQSGLSFNSVKLKCFQDMLEAVGAYGRHLKAPSYHAIRVPLLKKELKLTKDMLKTNEEEWATDGCSIMSDWRSVVFTLKVMAPLVRVLRLVDGDMKPAMGYIYEAMDKAKETIEKSFDRDESKYRDIFSIIDNRWDCQLHRPLHAAAHFLNPEIYYDNCRRIDYDLEIMRGLYDCIDRLVIGTELRNKVTSELEIYKTKKDLFGRELAELQRKRVAPAQWWKMFGHSAPNLQRFAIRILGLTCSASGCERNWSVFEQIHSKKRNRLEHQKLNDLVYVKYNQKLRERHEKRSELDPISLDDIDDCNEWLVGEMDDDDGEGGDLVFDDDTLDWDTVFDATGAGEPSTFTRSNTKKRKEPTTSDPRGKKSKSLVDEDDENEEENHDEPSEAEEEEEGYASLDDDGVHGDDYAEVDLDD